MPSTETKPVTTKSSNKLQRDITRKDANAAALRAAAAYFDQIYQAVLQAYLQKACPDRDPQGIPPPILADAKTLATVAGNSAAKHFPLLAEAFARAGVLAYQHTKGVKTANTRKSRVGGRKLDSTPWKVGARKLALFKPRIGLDAVIERLVAGDLISLDDEVVSVLNHYGRVTEQFDLERFKKMLSSLMSSARSKNFSGE